MSAVPNGVKFNNLNYKGDTISFQAQVPNRETLNILTGNLKSISFIKNVNIPLVEKKSGNDAVINTFFILKII